MRRLLPLCLLAFATACSLLVKPSDPWVAPREGVMRRGDYLIVPGVGRPDPKAESRTQRRSTSRDAAILSARVKLVDYLKSFTLSGISLGERAIKDEGWRKKLEEASAGIEVAETKWDDLDSAKVTLRIERAYVNRVLGTDE